MINQKSKVFTSLWESSPHALFRERLRSRGDEGLLAPRALGTVPFGLRQSGRKESCGGWGGGEINDTRMERMQPKCAGFSLMDCLPSLLPWGQ